MPEQLRAAAGGDEHALLELGERLERDGVVYTVTPVAVRFLVALASVADAARAIRMGALFLLARVAAARDSEPELLRAVLTALGTAEGALGQLLDDPEPAVAAAAAGLAGRFAEPPTAWTGRLRRLREESDDVLVKSNYAVALALAEGRPPDRDVLAEAAAVDAAVAAWREREASGLLGLRIGRSSAARLGALLARRAAARL